MFNQINIKPLADRVLIKPMSSEEKTKGGIFIPDTAKEKPQRGAVIAIGAGKKDEPLTVKVLIKFYMVNIAAQKSLSKAKIILL